MAESTATTRTTASAAAGTRLDTEVLIVGGGPVGLSLGLDLAHRGRDFLVAEATDGAVDHPKVGTVGPRSMELFRRWGISRRVRESGWPPDHSLDVAWVTALGGHEIHRLRFGTAATRPEPAHTPEPEQVCPQHWLMPLLLDALGTGPEGRVRLRWRLREFTEHEDRVVARVEDLAAGRTVTVESAYLVACDGARSPIRKTCGVPARTHHPTRRFRNILFRAPRLRSRLGPDEPMGHFLTTATLRYPLRAMDGDALYRLTASGEHGADLAPEEIIRSALAFDTPFEVLSDAPWHLTQRVAERYRHERVFFTGDAAHTLPPSGGLGMNTGIADAADLGWKLDAALAGWAGPHLLDTYESERKPVAEAALGRSNDNLVRALRHHLPPEIAADGEVGERARRELAVRLESSGVRREFDAPETHFGHRYRSPLVLADPCERADEHWRDSALPGGRAPHAWLGPGRSVLDLFGDGFVLLVQDPRRDGESLRRALAARGVPCAVVAVRDWPPAARPGQPLVLVRPDGHVAWRGAQPPRDPKRLADRVRGATLPEAGEH